MVVAPFSLREDYWDTFELREEDIEFLYNYLLEKETPETSEELLKALVGERIRREKLNIEKQRSSGGDIYLPKDHFHLKQDLVFPAFNWRHGKVTAVREGQNPELDEFQVVEVAFDDGEVKEFASGIQDHKLNTPLELEESVEGLDLNSVLVQYRDHLLDSLEEGLAANSGFVRIAGRWFPRALLVDINAGHLNLAEAVLDVEAGGPLPTSALLEQVGLAGSGNTKLEEFSMDLALQEDPRFDEVGPAGEVLWFLNRLEPEQVLHQPIYLRYIEMDYDRSSLTEQMLDLENELDDELSPLRYQRSNQDEVEIPLIFPHWRSGTLPLTGRIRHVFPTAYEAPRIRFTLIDGETDEAFPAWVVRNNRYVYGLREWYETHGLMPGSLIWVRQGRKPGEVIVRCDSRRSSRDWVRTVLVGSDGGVVFAMLRHNVNAAYDERMAIAVPDTDTLDQVWQQNQKDRVPFERIVVNTVRELAKLTPQSHVHASELYAAVNIVRRCPPGPILALLASRPWFIHVGDLHFRYDDSERA